MKILLVFLGILVAGAAGAGGAALFAPAPKAPATTEAIGPAPTTPVSAAITADLDRRLESLSMDLADLQDQVRDLRTQAARSPVVEVAQATPLSNAVMPAAQREQIAQVLTDLKAAEAARLEAERLQREEERRLQRADRVAQRFGLNEGQERQLADFYSVSQTKFDELRESMRAAREDGTLDGELMRSTMRDARDWGNSELERLFGPVTGKQIAEYEQDRFRGGFGGGGPGGDGGNNGNRPGRRGGNGGGDGSGGAPGG